MLKKETLVQVVWEDAWSDAGPYSEEEIHKEKPFITTSTGFAVKYDKKGIALSREIAPRASRRYRCIQFIPRAMIIEIKQFKSTKKI